MDLADRTPDAMPVVAAPTIFSASMAALTRHGSFADDVTVHRFVDLSARRALVEREHRVERDEAEAIAVGLSLRRAGAGVVVDLEVVQPDACALAGAGQLGAGRDLADVG